MGFEISAAEFLWGLGAKGFENRDRLRGRYRARELETRPEFVRGLAYGVPPEGFFGAEDERAIEAQGREEKRKGPDVSGLELWGERGGERDQGEIEAAFGVEIIERK